MTDLTAADIVAGVEHALDRFGALLDRAMSRRIVPPSTPLAWLLVLSGVRTDIERVAFFYLAEAKFGMGGTTAANVVSAYAHAVAAGDVAARGLSLRRTVIA